MIRMPIESASAPTEHPPLESANPNKTTIRHVFEECLCSGNLTVFNDALAPDYIGHVAGMPDLPPGPAGFNRFVTQLRRAFFDLDVTIDGVVARDGDVVMHLTASGDTGDRSWESSRRVSSVPRGKNREGKQVTLSTITVAQISGSRLRESRTEWPSLGFD